MRPAKPHKRSLWAAPAVAGAVLCACAGEEAPPTAGAEVTVRDSSGVQIVEVPEAALDALPVRRLADAPILSIGALEGEAPYLFSSISGNLRLDDGSFALVDGATREIRIFDPEGRFVRSIGRAGEGPGEFSTSPMIRHHTGGGLVAFDWPARVTVFDSLGSVVDHWRWDTARCQILVAGSDATTPCVPRGLLADGTILLANQEYPWPREELVGQTFHDLRATAGLGSAEAYLPLTSLRLPPMSVVRFTQSNGLERVVPDAPILSPLPIFAAGREHVVVAMEDRYELSVFDGAGTLRRIIRVARPPEPVTNAQRRMLLSFDPPLASAPEVVGVAEHWPAIGAAVRFGDGEDLWVPDFRFTPLTGPDTPTRFTIFGSDGVPVARVEVRANPIFEDQRAGSVVSAGREEYRVVTRDSLGVQRLLVFGIVEGSEAGTR